MDALGAKDKHLIELAQKLDLLTKKLDSLFAQSDELTRKQLALESLHELGVLLQRIGEIEDARTLLKESLVRHRRVFGDDHERTARAREALGRTYAAACPLVETVLR
jgi:hypothetical protein